MKKIAMLLSWLSGAALAFPTNPCALPSPTCPTKAASGASSVTGGHLLSAHAIFQVVDTQLTVMLSNVLSDDATLPSDVLTALFFNLRDDRGNGASDVYSNSAPKMTQPINDVVGGEREYRGPSLSATVVTPSASNPSGLSQGISSSGLGGFFDNPNFLGPKLQDPTGFNGLQYGMLSAGDNPGTGNGGVYSNDLVKDTTVFTLDRSLAAGRSLDFPKPGAIDWRSTPEQ